MDGIKILIVLVLAGVVASLGKALFHMSSGGADDAAHSAMKIMMSANVCRAWKISKDFLPVISPPRKSPRS